MLTGNVPNDIIQNIDPFALIIIIPIMDRIVYPLLRRFGFPMRPIVRISIGFLVAGGSMYVISFLFINSQKKTIMYKNGSN